MSYRITFNKPIPLHTTENKLQAIEVKLFDYGSTKFFTYNDKCFEIEQDLFHNIVGLTIHGNAVSDFRSLMNIKNKLFVE